MYAAHRARFVEMGKGTFQACAALPQESLAPGPANAPAIPVDGVAGRGLAAPVPPPPIGLREVGADADRLEVHQDLIAVIPGAGARAMTDSPTRVAAQRWHHWVPGAAVALMAAAATLLPGLAVAQDIYLRAGLDLSRPADTHFTDADCASLVPAALYGCGVGG